MNVGSKKILIFSGNPNVVSAASSIVMNIYDGFKSKGNEVFLSYVNHDMTAIEPKEINNIIRIDYFVDNYSLAELFSLERVAKRFLYICLKIIAKVLSLFCHFSLLEVLTIRKRISKIVKEKNIDTIYLINHSYHTRERCLFKINHYCKDVRCVWIELATLEKQSFFNKVNRFYSMNYIRHCDYHFFNNHINKNNICLLEFPMFGEHVTDLKCDFHQGKKLGYFGAFYKDVREPFFLIEFAKRNKNITMDFYTNKATFYKIVESIVLPENINVYDEVDYNSYKLLLANYDVLINIENSNYNSHPSKMYSYISSGLPILSIGVPDSYLHNLLTNHYQSYCYVQKDGNVEERMEIIQSFLNRLSITKKDIIDKYFYEITNEYIIKKMLE